MTEQNLPDEEFDTTGEDPIIPDEGIDAVPPDEVDVDPDQLAADPDEDFPGEDEDFPADQVLRDETEEARYEAGDEQVPPEVPTIGEASADVDFGEDMDDNEADSTDDPLNPGGSPLRQFEPEDLDQ